MRAVPFRRLSILVAAALTSIIAGAPSVTAQEGCYANCSGGLTPFDDVAPGPGEVAPEFSAMLLDSRIGLTSPQSLGSLLDGRPLILAFGSYTWMGFRSQFESLVRFAKRWRSVADIYMVYGREAFPEEAQWPAPVPDGQPVLDPQNLQARLELVDRFAEGIGSQLPFLVDDLSNSMMASYDAYPFRVFAITTSGTIAVRSDKGSAGFATTLERIDAWLYGAVQQDF